METAVKNSRTCLDCTHGKLDLSNGAVWCKKQEREIVQWFTTPAKCHDYKDQA
jgi:hypothetical protein